jgi:transposase
MSTQPRGTDQTIRRKKRFLTPLEKYEIWLQLVRKEVTMAEAAAAWKVDRTTITRIRTVAKDGALSALSASRPGAHSNPQDQELAEAKSEIERLSDTITRMAVKLTLAEGKEGWG